MLACCGRLIVATVALLVLAGSIACGDSAPAGASVQTTATPSQAPAVANSAPREPLRFSGTVEAVRSRLVSVPRLQGPATPLLVIDLVPAGTRVEPGDRLVEFDPQQQQREAFTRRAEVATLEGEILKKRAEQAAAEAKDRTAVVAAGHDVERARLDVRKNDLIPRIDAEKNTLALKQHLERLEQVELTFGLKRKAAEADLRILEIRRERAERALRYAEQNAATMQIQAPFGGLVVVQRLYRNGAFVVIAKGDELRPGTPIIDIVDTSAMRVRVRLNQADVRFIRTGQKAQIRLDGFPDLSFEGEVTTVTPLASPSQLSPAVRSFVAIVSIDGSHPQLLPDLTASVDIVPDDAGASGQTATDRGI